MPPDPVSWMVVERGWRVLDAAGDEIGKVDDVAGDRALDIFDGIVVSAGILSRPKYVPAEHVAEILEGEIRLDIGKDEVERLEALAPASVAERVRPKRWWERLLGR